VALGLAILVTGLGLALCISGRQAELITQGWIIVGFGALIGIACIRAVADRDASPERLTEYYDHPTQAGLIAALVWAVFFCADVYLTDENLLWRREDVEPVSPPVNEFASTPPVG